MLIFDNDLNLKIYTLIEPSIAININYLEKMRERDEDFQMEKLNLTFTGLKDSYTFNVKVQPHWAPPAKILGLKKRYFFALIAGLVFCLVIIFSCWISWYQNEKSKKEYENWLIESALSHNNLGIKEDSDFMVVNNSEVTVGDGVQDSYFQIGL